MIRHHKLAQGLLRVGGISTTAMDAKNPRFSTPEHLARDLVSRGAEMARCLLEREIAHARIVRGGRKASA